jgi:hypothetical protein
MLPQRLVPAVYELGWMARAFLGTAAVELGADAVLRSVAELSGRDLFAGLLVFGLPSFAILTTLVLGRRTDAPILYAQIFDRAPGPPPEARVEAGGTIARRAVMAVIALALGMLIPAAFGIAFLLVMMGTPRDDLLQHLPVATGLVAAGWMLLCGLVALRISQYFARWEQRRGKVVLCRPLASGTMRHVYYAANRPPTPAWPA